MWCFQMKEFGSTTFNHMFSAGKKGVLFAVPGAFTSAWHSVGRGDIQWFPSLPLFWTNPCAKVVIFPRKRDFYARKQGWNPSHSGGTTKNGVFNGVLVVKRNLEGMNWALTRPQDFFSVQLIQKNRFGVSSTQIGLEIPFPSFHWYQRNQFHPSNIFQVKSRVTLTCSWITGISSVARPTCSEKHLPGTLRTLRLSASALRARFEEPAGD